MTLSISDLLISHIWLTDRIKVKILKENLYFELKIQIYSLCKQFSKQKMSIADIKKSIETFLEKNNLNHTL